ncbi:MAG TPA: DNA starvation/stationary phase protection protein [Oligoflexia bacterium]|nr:DNA starvation/stationary phase protection protein [Oligoflexia bacterium]HMR25053.1 DNA starvation/stationary phase protection protein [Oligoflexia bacterium]
MTTKETLRQLLADSYTLNLKTQNYHWNVTGPMFSSLHTLFEAQYNEFFAAIDVIAERIKALGDYAPGSYQEYMKLTQIKESTGQLHWKDMVSQLLEGHEKIIATLKKSLAEGEHDDVSEDLFIGRLDVHEKTAWMLRSILAD